MHTLEPKIYSGTNCQLNMNQNFVCMNKIGSILYTCVQSDATVIRCINKKIGLFEQKAYFSTLIVFNSKRNNLITSILCG